MSANTDTRLYPSAIAVVSGIYSMAAATRAGGMGSMPMGGSVMLVIGVVVLLHGIALLTPLADRFGRVSGPLMILWAAIMLGNQALAVGVSTPLMGDASWDGGMVAVAVLMLASGLIMIRGREM